MHTLACMRIHAGRVGLYSDQDTMLPITGKDKSWKEVGRKFHIKTASIVVQARYIESWGGGWFKCKHVRKSEETNKNVKWRASCWKAECTELNKVIPVFCFFQSFSIVEDEKFQTFPGLKPRVFSLVVVNVQKWGIYENTLKNCFLEKA